jgi:hypothetical protein
MAKDKEVPVQRAHIKNVQRLAALAEKVTGYARHRPRMACFSGWSGYGKSTAAAYCRQEYRCFWVEAPSTWTKKTMLEDLFRAVGGGAVPPKMNATRLAEEVAWRMSEAGRALIIDEFDRVCDRGLIEAVRDIYMKSDATPIIVIGEEALPAKIDQNERFSGRIGAWGQAEPLDLEDARLLSGLYTPQIDLSDPLLESMIRGVAGSARRITSALYDVADFAVSEGLSKVDLADWGERAWTAGARPAVRAVGQRGAAA